MLLQSLSLTPLLWSSWLELAKLCKDREMVNALNWLNDQPCPEINMKCKTTVGLINVNAFLMAVVL